MHEKNVMFYMWFTIYYTESETDKDKQATYSREVSISVDKYPLANAVLAELRYVFDEHNIEMIIDGDLEQFSPSNHEVSYHLSFYSFEDAHDILEAIQPKMLLLETYNTNRTLH